MLVEVDHHVGLTLAMQRHHIFPLVRSGQYCAHASIRLPALL